MENLKLVNESRLKEDLFELGKIGFIPNQGIHRTALSNYHIESLRWLKSKLKASGIKYFTDNAGNIIATINEDRKKSVIATGSHLDSVPAGGNLDGGLGVIAGLECLRVINENKIETSLPVQLIVFNDEEGHYGSMLGSGILTGKKSIEELNNSKNLYGETLKEAFIRNEMDFDSILTAKLPINAIDSFIELHIEQGPILEDLGVPIGIAQNIFGIKKLEVSLIGEAKHSGTTPMNKRKDALLCFSKLMLELNDLIKKDKYKDSVLNVGYINSVNGAPNIVPGLIEFSLEIRSADNRNLEELTKKSINLINDISKKNSIEARIKEVLAMEPTKLSEDLILKIKSNCELLNLKYHEMTSGAAHDAQNMASICKSSLIFIPSCNGISHSPKEDSKIEDIVSGSNLLLNVMLDLAS